MNLSRCRYFVIACLTTAAWGSLGAATAPPRQGPASQATKPAADEVAALVNGERVMLSELMARLGELGVPPERQDDVAPSLLDTLVDNLLLVQFLTAQRVPYDAKAVDAEVAQVRAELEKQGKRFDQALAQFGMTPEKLRRQAIAEAQWESYLKKRATDKVLADYLAKHREQFDSSEVRARHILVELPADANATAQTAAQSKMERIRKELAAGADFAQAARKYSDCPSKEQGGDVGFFPRQGKMVEPFARAAFALQVGQTSDVVKTEFGYHLIQVTERKPGKTPKLDEVRPQVMQALGEEMKDAIIAQQRKTAKIEIAPDIPEVNASASPAAAARPAAQKPSTQTQNSSAAKKTPTPTRR